jgi:flagellar basal-body rod protein FlgB
LARSLLVNTDKERMEFAGTMKFDDAFSVHPQALLLRQRRAEVLASNLANADTPGYKARDFDFHKVLNTQMTAPAQMKTTSPGHIQPQRGLVPSNNMGYRVPFQVSLDGNTVDTQIEHTAHASNALEYQASLRFLNGKISSLRKAITGN